MKKTQALEVVGNTDPGCVRSNNEDDFAIEPELGLMVIADGMGGHNSGEVASDIATKTIRDFARQMLGGNKSVVPEGGDKSLSVRGRQLEYFVKTANTMIYEKGRAFPKDAGMGTTVAPLSSNARTTARPTKPEAPSTATLRGLRLPAATAGGIEVWGEVMWLASPCVGRVPDGAG